MREIKILAINIFIILENVSNSCIMHFYEELKLIQLNLEEAGKPILSNFLLGSVLAFLVMQYLFIYLAIAGHIIALYPILKMNQPDLLLPSMYTHLFQNIVLKIIELIFGFALCHFDIIAAPRPCKFFCVKVLTKIFLALYIL